MSIRAIGIDPSLTRTAVALADDHRVRVGSITTQPAAGLHHRAARMDKIVQYVHAAIGGLARTDGPTVYIEGPAHSRTTGHHHDRSALWWLIVRACHAEGLTVVEVSPSTLKKYACGRGNASKDEVILALARRHGDRLPITNNDEADAAALALIGARLAEHPLDGTLPQSHLAALQALQAAP